MLVNCFGQENVVILFKTYWVFLMQVSFESGSLDHCFIDGPLSNAR